MQIIEELQEMYRVGRQTGAEAGTFAQVNVEKQLNPRVAQLLELREAVPQEFRAIYPQRVSELVAAVNACPVSTATFRMCVEKLLNLERSIEQGLLRRAA